MKKQALLAGIALAVVALSPYAISAASATSRYDVIVSPDTGPAVPDNKIPDGTVYTGVSPDTHKPLYTPPAGVIVPWIGGERAADGTIYAGISPEAHKPFYTTPADAPGIYTWSKGADYCHALQVSGHQDWRVPTKDELNLLYENRDKEALKGSFNETGGEAAGWYWSSVREDYGPWSQRFSNGVQDQSHRIDDASLRCVR